MKEARKDGREERKEKWSKVCFFNSIAMGISSINTWDWMKLTGIILIWSSHKSFKSFKWSSTLRSFYPKPKSIMPVYDYQNPLFGHPISISEQQSRHEHLGSTDTKLQARPGSINAIRARWWTLGFGFPKVSAIARKSQGTVNATTGNTSVNCREHVTIKLYW